MQSFRLFLKPPCVGLFALGLALPSLAFSGTIGDLSAGAPHLKGKVLVNNTYVEIEAKRFSRARVLWLNFDWLREHQISFPEQGLIPEFEQQVLDAFAYGIPRTSDDLALFSEKSKTFYADRYGGTGLGLNTGSGRAASVGGVQIKGIGITPLVAPGQTLDHAHGGASIEESIREAIWGEINHRELPHGSNRVIAIIDTGTDTVWTNGGHEKRALIVREDPLRPAQFMVPTYGEPSRIQESAVKGNIENIQAAFHEIAPELQLNDPQFFKKAYLTYARRLGEQYSTAYAKRLYHGATSQSNVDFTGKYLDFGTETYLPSFQNTHVLSHVQGFGKLSEIESTLIRSPLSSIRSNSKKPGLFPSNDEAVKVFQDAYRENMRLELLKLTGAPSELLPTLLKSEAVRRFGDELFHYTEKEFTSPFNLIMDRDMPAELKTTQLGNLLVDAARTGDLGQELFNQYQVKIPESLKLTLKAGYAQFRKELLTAANEEGIQEDALQTYLNENSRLLNRPVDELLRPKQIWKDIQLVDGYDANSYRDPIWNEINHQIEGNTRNLKTNKPYEIVLERSQNHLTGKEWRKIFNLKTNTYSQEEGEFNLHPVRPFTGFPGCKEAMEGLSP